MKERPILFSGPLVRAILAGRKTETRRVVKLPSGINLVERSTAGEWLFSVAREGRDPALIHAQRCPYGGPGDRLWVRETWRPWGWDDDQTPYCLLKYRADGGEGRTEMPRSKILQWAAEYDAIHPGDEAAKVAWWDRWRPSIHMPRWASRILLEVTDVRVERLQAITEEGARAEGVEPAPFCKSGRPVGMWHVETFECLWDEINSKRAPWGGNPWVWVVSFKRVEGA